MSEPSHPAADRGSAGFEAPRPGRRGPWPAVAVGVALLLSGIGFVALGDSPDGAEDIGMETDEPDEIETSTDEAPDETPTDDVIEPLDEVDQTVEDPGDPAEPERSDPGSVRPGGDQPGEHVDLAGRDTPDGTLVVAGTAGIAVVDLASGDVRERADEGTTPGGVHGLAVVGDVIVHARGSEVALHDMELSGEPDVLDVEGPQVVVAPGGTAWVGAGGVNEGSSARHRWTPVNPQTSEVGDPVDLPLQAQVRGATDEGLAVVRANRTFLVADGAVRAALDHGDLLHAGPGGLLWHTCTDEFECGLEATALGRDVPRSPVAPEGLDEWNVAGHWPSNLSEDGTRAVLLMAQQSFGLAMVDLDEETTATHELGEFGGPVAISSDGAWVAAHSEEPMVWAPDRDLEIRPPVDVGQPMAIALN